MKNKKRVVPYYQYIISLICVAFLCGGSAYIYFDRKFNQYAASSPGGDFKKIESLYNEIHSNYVGKIDDQALINGALKGMTNALDDPYSTYLDIPEANELNNSLSGSFEGIGATMTMINDLPAVAQAPIEDSPAEKAGLKTDDTILKIDGESTDGLTLSEVVTKIRGEKGTEVKLTILRGEDTFDVNITRDTIPIKTVSGTIDDHEKTVGNIRITTFGENTYEELQEAIKKLRKEGATSFVIDLRQNPGGLLNQVEQMASMFLEDGETIVQFEDKDGNKYEDVASKQLDDGFKVTEPTVVLVDEGSASASEIFAAALKESGNKKVIGTKTFGKGTVQNIKNLSDDSELKLTILKWLTPDGEWIHEKGLEPSIEADYPEYAYLNPISKDKVLKVGDSSDVIKNVNKILKALDYDVNGDSADFTEQTKAAVSDVQKKNDLPVTGEIDNDTAEKIEEELGKKITENDNAYKKAITELKKEKK
ncbi:S41 family peptidase [Enterococcus sp. LJL99]